MIHPLGCPLPNKHNYKLILSHIAKSDQEPILEIGSGGATRPRIGTGILSAVVTCKTQHGPGLRSSLQTVKCNLNPSVTTSSSHSTRIRKFSLLRPSWRWPTSTAVSQIVSSGEKKPLIRGEGASRLDLTGGEPTQDGGRYGLGPISHYALGSVHQDSSCGGHPYSLIVSYSEVFRDQEPFPITGTTVCGGIRRPDQ